MEQSAGRSAPIDNYARFRRLLKGHNVWLRLRRLVTLCFWEPCTNILTHSLTQNCCWVTQQVSHHQGQKNCVKMEGKTIFFDALQAVMNRDCRVFGNH